MSIYDFEVKPKDFSDYPFRCSSLGSLVGAYVNYATSPALTEKQQEEHDRLSLKPKITELQSEKLKSYQEKINKKASSQIELMPGTKTVLKEIFDEEVLGYKPFSDTKATVRGNRDEQASIDLINRVYNTNYIKNEKKLSNPWIEGTPDILSLKVGDVKTAENKKTFDYYGQKQADKHEWQLWGYEQLKGVSNSVIIRTLPSYPDDVIAKETERLLRYATEDTDIQALQRRIYLNHNYDRIEESKRVKIFEVETYQGDPSLVWEYLEICRAYLNGMVKNYFNL